MICIRGKQIIPKGESGVYFICQFGINKNKQCRWAKWCEDQKQYESRTDDNGYLCSDFSLEEEKVIVEEIPVAIAKEESLVSNVVVNPVIESPKEPVIVTEEIPEKKDLISERLKEQIANSLKNSNLEIPTIDNSRYLPKI
jgi:hypothetical protein